MTKEELEQLPKFEDIVKAMAATYKSRNLELREIGENQYLYCDGEPRFCTTGFCLLYNMKRLCEVLENELM